MIVFAHMLLKKLGLGLRVLLGKKRQNTRLSPAREEHERFKREVREQLLKLKEKGLSIPVFTL
jgi:hypothetical protein